jgi:sulfonate transport system substrate-binding protein
MPIMQRSKFMDRTISGICRRILMPVAVAGTILLSAGCSGVEQNLKNGQTLRMGWMTSWATAGQIVQALKHTNITSLYGVKLNFSDYLYGVNINEAALRNDLDVVNTGLVPAISLLSRDSDWLVVGRLLYNEMNIIVPSDSKASSLNDLRGKSVATPFGGGTHVFLLRRLAQIGTTAGDEPHQIRLLNVAPTEQLVCLTQGAADAAATWEPQSTMIVERNAGRVIERGPMFGLIMVRKSFAENHATELKALLKSYLEANLFTATHAAQTDKWFVEESGFDPAMLKKITVVEPNMKARNARDINMTLSIKDLKLAQDYADDMYKADLIAKPVHFSSHTDQRMIREAQTDIFISGMRVEQVASTDESKSM